MHGESLGLQGHDLITSDRWVNRGDITESLLLWAKMHV
jgi:hypothetical protein